MGAFRWRYSKKHLVWTLIIALIIGLFVIGVFYDLAISKAIAAPLLDQHYYGYYEPISLIVEIFGWIPVLLLFSASLMILTVNYQYQHYQTGFNKANLLLILISTINILALEFFCFNPLISTLFYNPDQAYPLKTAAGWTSIISFIGGMIGGTLLTYWLLKRVNRIDKEKLDSYRQWCWQTITLIITLLVLTLVIKYSMPRYRFRAINLLNESVLFTPIFVVDPKWYEFYHDYPIDWIQSFPSGHVLTNMGCLMLLTLPGISVQRQRKINLYVLLYLLLIGWMRIENGAHFLTDVCFAYLLGIGTWAISQWLVKRRNVHHRRTHQLMD